MRTNLDLNFWNGYTEYYDCLLWGFRERGPAIEFYCFLLGPYGVGVGAGYYDIQTLFLITLEKDLGDEL